MKNLSNHVNHLIKKLTKKLSKVLISPKLETDPNRRNNKKNTCLIKSKRRLQGFWIVMKKVMIKKKKTLS